MAEQALAMDDPARREEVIDSDRRSIVPEKHRPRRARVSYPFEGGMRRRRRRRRRTSDRLAVDPARVINYNGINYEIH